MDCSLTEFLAENELVAVEPRFNAPELRLVCGDFGPFIAGDPVRVPLWIAIYLKQIHKCNLIAPDWLNVNALESIKKEEVENRTFSRMPSEHWRGIAHLFLIHAADNLPQGDEIKTLLKDIWDIRMAKLRASIDAFVKTQQTHAAVNNLTPLEVCQVREFLTESLDCLRFLQTTARVDAAEMASSSILDVSQSQ